MKILITGIAGMIGFHSARYFASQGWEVCGVDNFNPYYDPQLKEDRAEILRKEHSIPILRSDIQDFHKHVKGNPILDNVDVVLHLAAYANPRHSFEQPQHYIDTNITGTQRIIEVLEEMDIPIVYASSSCVMHGQPLPWNEHDRPAHQNNPYGWSKRANECQFMHSKIKRSAGLRFFTVYGPYGRPDMALFKFTDLIVKGKPIDLYNFGDMKRDFTYVDDIVQGIGLVVDKVTSDTDTYHEIYNIGYGQQVQLLDFVDHIETNLGRKAERNLCPAHPADTPETWSDTTKLQQLGYNPTTPIAEGVEKFVSWYKEYYKVN
jgi:UDP-glucuronate 4-epimerase